MRTLPMLFLLCLLGSATAADQASPIHTVLPFDAIPAIFSPKFLSAEDADVHNSSPMIGVSFGGEQHAYSMVLLNAYEIVNDIVGGRSIASTW